MTFNSQLYREIYSVRKERNTREDLYCFATGQKLGENGKLDEHPLYGKKFKSTYNFKIYTVDSVNIHFWEGGYYYFVVLIDERGSSAPRHWENINSTNELTLNCIQETQEQFEPFSS
jgi:hypothetical protein